MCYIIIFVLALDFTAVYDEMKPYFPSSEDYEGAMTALFRLQDTYKLPSLTFAKGKFNIINKIYSDSSEAL